MNSVFDYYTLDGHKTVGESNFMAWAKWFETANRVVKKTQVADGVEVSTVFLGIDHGDLSSHELGQPIHIPILFETMIFGGTRDGEMNRYATWDEAVAGHDEILKEFIQRCPYCGTLRKSDEVKCSSCGGNF
jgi:hypothetical protein